jgi:hypothetical protein
MSIGIVGIGLIGVSSLIPVAHDYSMKAIVRDRAAELGQRAFREFKLRGFDRPGTLSQPHWFYPGPGGIGTIFYSTNPPNPPLVPPPNWESEKLVLQSYCFDPVHIAARLAPGSLLPPSPNFPENNTLFAVPRVSALSSRLEHLYPGVAPRNLLTELSRDLAGSNPNLWPIIHSWQAEAICSLQDDLVYHIPDDESLPTYQEFRTIDHDNRSSTPDVRNARLNEGNFSWMATIVPDIEVRYDLAGAPFAFRKSDNYNLSIAVFHRRSVNDPQKPVQEIISPVVLPGAQGSYTVPAVGTTTKELHIQPTSAYDPARGATFDELQPGKWILVGQEIEGVRTLKWMKVVSKPEIDYSGTIPSYLFSATGPDFSYYVQNSMTGQLVPIPTFVIYVRDVVNVYEKTVRLQGSSSYES